MIASRNGGKNWLSVILMLTFFFVCPHELVHSFSITLRRISNPPIYVTNRIRHTLYSENNDENSEFSSELLMKEKEDQNTVTRTKKKESEWNTSIFPTKVAMSPPVERNKFAPQASIQTIAALIGIVTGISVSMFKLLIDAVRHIFYDSTFVESGLVPIFLIPIFGSIGVALLSTTGEFSPGLRGIVKEVDEDSLALQFKNALIANNYILTDKDEILQQLNNALKNIRKSIAAIVTLGTGNSLGPEGPAVEIGAAISRLGMLLWPTNFIKDKDSFANKIDCESIARNRLLLACGAAAGVSSGFNAPLSGVFFALEVVQASLRPVNVPASIPAENDTRGISSESVNANLQLQQQSLSANQGSITAILISSVLAALVVEVILGNELALELVKYEIRTPLIELPLYIVLGTFCGMVSVVFSQSAKFFKNVFDGNIGPEMVKETFRSIPVTVLSLIGGCTSGFVGYFYPQVLFFGYDTLNKLLEDTSIPTNSLLSLLAVKTLTTAICAGSGLVGGEM